MGKRKAILMIIILGFLLYFNSLFNNFVWDDEEQILNNYLVHSLKNLPSFFTGSTFNPGGAVRMGGIYYKPLMMVCFSFLYSLFGPRSFFFHLFQVGLHIINSILVFLLFDYFFNQLYNGRCIVGNQEKKVNDKGVGIAFFLSLIFLVHPQNSEAVLYISAIQDVLFFFFGMLGLLTITATDSFASLSFTGSTYRRFFIATFFLLLSLLSKETGIVFFVLIFFYLFLFKREKISHYFLFLLLTIWVYGLLRFAIAGIGFQKQGLSPITRMGFWQRMVSVPKIIFFYLKTFFYPKDLAINQHWVVEKIGWLDFYLPLGLVIGFFFWLIRLCIGLSRPWQSETYERRIFLFFFFWFILSLSLHLHLFPLDMTVSDRWFYLPMVGLLGMVGTIALKLKVQSPKLKVIIVITIIGSLSLRTFFRTFNWRNGLTLYSHDIKISKNAFDLENNLGVELFRAGKIDQAKVHFEASTKLAPFWWTNWNNLGVVYERKGDFKKAEEYYKKAIDSGDYYLAFENYAEILIKQKKYQKAKEFLEKEALPKLPYNQKLRQLYLYILGTNNQ